MAKRKSLHLPISLAYAKGAWSVAVTFGSPQALANLLLDSGSSTLVVLPRAYDPSRDRNLKATSWAQQVNYGVGAWAGPVLESSAAFGHGEHARAVETAHFALVSSDAQNFRDADGILGLAFTGLNNAHDATTLLHAAGVDPALTWPWPFSSEDAASVSAFRQELLAQPRVELLPLFSELEEEGVVADKFALAIDRSLVHVLHDDAPLSQLVDDPLNRGTLVVGGGEEAQELYEGGFVDIRLVHELYYNANLIAVQVGDDARIPAPPLAEQYVEGYASNGIIDTGSTFLVLEGSLYDAVIAAFERRDPRLTQRIAQFQQAFKQEQGIDNAHVDALDWPDLHLILEGEDAPEVRLTIKPGHYWQRNALVAGQAFFLLMRQLPNWPNQSILGLPMLAGRYCVFDRRRDGAGVVRVARARSR